MTHLPFIAASYGLAVLVMGWFAVGAAVRLRTAKRKLAAVDTRRPR
jgi:heme exporter protein D